MSSELLRRAAKEMRERAEAIDSLHWWVEDGEHVRMRNDLGRLEVWDAAEAEHIASWDPAVALGVASLLENLADELDRVRPCEKDCANCGDMRWSWPTAELIAKDYLGEAS